ncbi:hypothetical protein D9M69_529590 [compost metagenome]
MLETKLDTGHRQHLDPDLEQEFAHFVAHRHIVEQLAQLDGVLHGQRFLLFHLLGHRDKPACVALPAEVGREKLLELVEHQLEHPASGFRVLFDHLHHAFDFHLQRGRGDIGFEAHDTGTHAVDQATRRVLQGTEKLGLG